MKICSGSTYHASLPGGDQVDGLPPAQHTHPLVVGPQFSKFEIWSQTGFKHQNLSTQVSSGNFLRPTWSHGIELWIRIKNSENSGENLQLNPD